MPNVSKSTLRRQFTWLPLALSVWTFATSLMDPLQTYSSWSKSLISDISIVNREHDRSDARFEIVRDRPGADRPQNLHPFIVYSSTSSCGVYPSERVIHTPWHSFLDSRKRSQLPDRGRINQNQYPYYRTNRESYWSHSVLDIQIVFPRNSQL